MRSERPNQMVKNGPSSQALYPSKLSSMEGLGEKQKEKERIFFRC